MNRSKSLERLLLSLSKANFFDDEVNVEIIVDALPNSNSTDFYTFMVLQRFQWKIGTLYISYNKQNVGLRSQWLKKYNLKVPFIILEDDLELSTDFYGVAKRAILYVNSLNSSNVFGISLHKAFFALKNENCPYYLPLRCLAKYPQLRNSSFFAPIMSTWGPILFSHSWNQLIDYSTDFFRVDKNFPCIPGAITNKWTETSGTFMQYYLYIKSFFIMYINLEYDLIFHHREKGLHFRGTEKKQVPKFFSNHLVEIHYSSKFIFDHGYNFLKNGLNTVFDQKLINQTNPVKKCYVRK